MVTRIYLCPSVSRHNCHWEGEAHLIRQHFETVHPKYVHYKSDIAIDLTVANDNHLLCFQDDDIYLLQTEIDSANLDVKLRCLDNPQTKHYALRVIVSNVDAIYGHGEIRCLVTRLQHGWNVDLRQLRLVYGDDVRVKCQIVMTSQPVARQLRKQSVETNDYDEIERNLMNDLKLIDERIRKLNNDQSTDLAWDLSEANSPVSDVSLGEIGAEPKKCPLNRKGSSISDAGVTVTHTRPKTEVSRSASSASMFKPSKKAVEPCLEETEEGYNLQCSSCDLDMLPPIFLCLNGHNVCSACSKDPCKLCDSPITKYRNTELENVSRTQKHPCRYQKEGCLEKLYYNEVRGHEAQCTFCKYHCVMQNCTFEGKYPNFHNHLKIMHGSVKVRNTLTNDFPKNTEFFIADSAKGVFYCRSVQTGEAIEWSAMFCGPKERQFFCELVFKGSKAKETFFLKKRGNEYVLKKLLSELKKVKAKEKHAVLTITSYDSN